MGIRIIEPVRGGIEAGVGGVFRAGLGGTLAPNK